ncbi:MAG: glycosyltransferase family 2 protein [Anaerolineae bacterium]|nr:glycosyltransferase family 2 protein [Anaerolineae bacterium]
MRQQPLVTIIMPVRNEAAFIERSLGAVLAQDYPSERMEVLIVDGMSDDGTCEMIRAMTGTDRVRIIPNPKRIQAAGLNLGILEATGEYVVRVDGHTIVAPDYVRSCLRTLSETGAQNAGGAMDPVGTTPMGKAIAAAGKSAFAVPSAFHVSSREGFTDTVYLGAWPRSVLLALGGYNETFAVNEDYELNYRIRAGGGRVYFSPTIRSTYYGRQTLKVLARQYFRYGMSKVATLRLHPGSVRVRQLVAPVFVAGLAIGPLLGLLHPLILTIFLATVTCYLVLNLIFSARVASRKGWALMRRIPLVFAVIHLAWGTGFWAGIIRSMGSYRSKVN